MTKNTIVSGLELQGTGPPAEARDVVVYNLRIYLNRGDELLLDETQAVQQPAGGGVETVDGRPLFNHRLTLGKRQVIAGEERALIGMKPGGFRRARVSPHLVYGKGGFPALVRANVVLSIDLWMHAVRQSPGPS